MSTVFGSGISSAQQTFGNAAGSEIDPAAFYLFDTQPEAIYGAQAVYTVFRGKKEIGQHTLTFSQANDELRVEVDSELAVKYLGVTVYRYRYESSETWRRGVFHSVTSEVRDNRKPVRKISAELEGRLLRITDSASSESTSRGAAKVGFPSNHWHPGVLNAARLFHTLHGRVYPAMPQDMGWEKTALATGEVVSARHFQYRDGFRADVWYDKQMRWVKLEFAADDGSTIRYSCKRCSPDY